MQFPNLSILPAGHQALSNSFANYNDTGRLIRTMLQIERLPSAMASAIREACRKHAERAERRESNGVAAKTTVDRLRVRLAADTAAAVSRHMGDLFRSARSSWAGGNTTDRVLVRPGPHASGESFRAWSSNGKWSGTDLRRVVHVMPSWRTRIERRGLASLDGLLTTHAEPIHATGDIETYRASWVRQGRGYDLIAESGVIALHRPSGTAYHAKDADDLAKAVRGLKRKLTAQAIPQEERDRRRRERTEQRRERQASALADLVARVLRHDLGAIGKVAVTLADSYAAGNCQPGTLAFRDRHFPGRSSATIGEIADRLSLINLTDLSPSDLTLARQVAAACLVAIRRDKQTRRLTHV